MTLRSLTLALACLAAPGALLAQEPSAELKQLVEGNNAFTCDIYKQVAGEPGNKFLSPFSISTALGMTWAGARNETAAQMALVLRFPLEQEELHAAFGELQGLLGTGAAPGMTDALGGGRRQQQTPPPAPAEPPLGPDGQPQKPKELGVRLDVANALWAEKTWTFLPSYVDLVTSSYSAGIQNLDFKQDPDGSRDTINNWVAERTQQMIKDLLKKLEPTTRLVLTNAIYFKGKWGAPFEKAATDEQAKFTLADGTKVDAPLMFQESRVRYKEDTMFQAVELPYGDLDRASMLIILPRDTNGLASIENKLSAQFVSDLRAGMQSRKVRVHLPRFEMESEFQLGKTLVGMGMTHAFDGDLADFSGMTGKKDLVISQVIHKAKVIVNEEGTEAAAATAVIVVETTSVNPNPTPTFRADRPFLFLIQDHRTGSILFLGRVADPRG